MAARPAEVSLPEYHAGLCVALAAVGASLSAYLASRSHSRPSSVVCFGAAATCGVLALVAINGLVGY